MNMPITAAPSSSGRGKMAAYSGRKGRVAIRRQRAATMTSRQIRAAPPSTPRSSRAARVIVVGHFDVAVLVGLERRPSCRPARCRSGVSPVKYSRSVSDRIVLREPLLSAWRPIESFSSCELAWACCTMR